MGRGDTLLNAAIGAVVTLLTSFLGVSPILGGGVAGYLQKETRKRGAMVGALSGVLASVPVAGIVLVVFLLGFVALPVDPGVALGGLGAVLIAGVVMLLATAWNVVLGAAGGYVGTYIREEYEGTGDRDASS